MVTLWITTFVFHGAQLIQVILIIHLLGPIYLAATSRLVRASKENEQITIHHFGIFGIISINFFRSYLLSIISHTLRQIFLSELVSVDSNANADKPISCIFWSLCCNIYSYFYCLAHVLNRQKVWSPQFILRNFRRWYSADPSTFVTDW
jgi:hypothetical protein